MEQKNEKEIMHLFGQEIKRRFGHRLKKVIFFGSRARGDSVHDSDYDCLVILDEISPAVKDAIDEIAGEFLYRYNVVLSVLPKLDEEIREHPYSPLLMNAFREGIVL
jgi:predicted nucleotidyltransferase